MVLIQSNFTKTMRTFIPVSFLLCSSLCKAETASTIGLASATSSQFAVSHAITTAKNQLGTKYRYGGNSPSQGFDCSGLVHYSFAQAGVELPRTSREQFKALTPTPDPKPGDLIYFGMKGRVNHVGIYLGNDQMLHSPSSGKLVEITNIDTPRWQSRYLGARTPQPKSLNATQFI